MKKTFLLLCSILMVCCISANAQTSTLALPIAQNVGAKNVPNVNTIYVRLTQINTEQAPRYTYQDLVVSFYSDAAGTQPVSVSNLQVNISKYDYGSFETAFSLTGNGTSVVSDHEVIVARNLNHEITDEYTYAINPSPAYQIIP